MVATETCPALADLAAFVEGRLAGEERDRMVRHLNQCPECFEVYTETAELVDALDEEGSEGSARPSPVADETNAQATVSAPFPRKLEEKLSNFGPPHSHRIEPKTLRMRRTKLRPALRWVAAASIILVGGGWALWSNLVLSPLDTQFFDSYVQTLSSNQRLGLLKAVDIVLPINRGADDPGTGSVLAQDFRYGELLTDKVAACSRPLADADGTDSTCKRVEKAIDNLFANNASLPITPKEASTSLSFQLGRWNAAARLALESKQTRYFERPQVRRFPAWLLRQERWPRLSRLESVTLPREVKKALEEVDGLLSGGTLDARQLEKLTNQIAAIAEAYRPEQPDALQPP
jgi:hypothetical protein